MVQGKFKKVKLPSGIQKKQKSKNTAAFTRRSNAPVQPKKAKLNELQKIKNVVSKSVNKSMEAELRSRAKESQLNLSRAQKAVAKYHQKLTSSGSTVVVSSASASISDVTEPTIQMDVE